MSPKKSLMRCDIARIIRVIDTQNFQAGNETHCIELQVCRPYCRIHEFSTSQQYTRKEGYTVFAFLSLLVWSHLTIIHINIMTFRNWNLAWMVKCTTLAVQQTPLDLMEFISWQKLQCFTTIYLIASTRYPPSPSLHGSRQSIFPFTMWPSDYFSFIQGSEEWAWINRHLS